jgi:hypothetical protein
MFSLPLTGVQPSERLFILRNLNTASLVVGNKSEHRPGSRQSLPIGRGKVAHDAPRELCKIAAFAP